MYPTPSHAKFKCYDISITCPDCATKHKGPHIFKATYPYPWIHQRNLNTNSGGAMTTNNKGSVYKKKKPTPAPIMVLPSKPKQIAHLPDRRGVNAQSRAIGKY